VGDLTLAIPQPQGFSVGVAQTGQLLTQLVRTAPPGRQGPRRRGDEGLHRTGGISTRKGDALVEALGGASGISKSEISRICQGLDEQVKAFLGRPLDNARFPYVYLDAT